MKKIIMLDGSEVQEYTDKLVRGAMSITPIDKRIYLDKHYIERLKEMRSYCTKLIALGYKYDIL